MKITVNIEEGIIKLKVPETPEEFICLEDIELTKDNSEKEIIERINERMEFSSNELYSIIFENKIQ